MCFLVVYVDDLLLAASSRAFMNDIKGILLTAFKMKDLGEAKYILGLELQRDRKEGKISLSQTQYICTVLERTGMSESKPVWTPLTHNAKLVSQPPDTDGNYHPGDEYWRKESVIPHSNRITYVCHAWYSS